VLACVPPSFSDGRFPAVFRISPGPPLSSPNTIPAQNRLPIMIFFFPTIVFSLDGHFAWIDSLPFRSTDAADGFLSRTVFVLSACARILGLHPLATFAYGPRLFSSTPFPISAFLLADPRLFSFPHEALSVCCRCVWSALIFPKVSVRLPAFPAVFGQSFRDQRVRPPVFPTTLSRPTTRGPVTSFFDSAASRSRGGFVPQSPAGSCFF